MDSTAIPMLQPGNNGTGPDRSNHLCQKHSPKRACVNSVKHAGTQKYDRGWKGPCLPGPPHLIAVLQETVHIHVNHTICFDTPRRRHDPATRSGLILPDWGAQRGENSIQSRTVGGTKETEGKFRASGASIQSRTVGQRERRGEGGGGLLLAKVGLGLQIAGSDAHLLAANAEKGKRGREGDAQGGGGAIVGSVGIDHSSKTHPMKANVPVQSGGIGAVLFCPGGWTRKAVVFAHSDGGSSCAKSLYSCHTRV